MIITVDGCDGVGKTILSKLLAQYYGYIYIPKPIDLFLKVKQKKSFRYKLSLYAQKFIYDINKSERAKVYFACSLLSWISKKYKNKNIVIDRGILSNYNFNGSHETDYIYDKYISKELRSVVSVYLVADLDNRINRLKTRNVNDPDLHNDKILNLKDDRALDFAKSRGLNVIVIDTNNKNINEVFKEAVEKLDENKNFKNIDNGRNFS